MEAAPKSRIVPKESPETGAFPLPGTGVTGRQATP
jgi:hypothetical protein